MSVYVFFGEFIMNVTNIKNIKFKRVGFLLLNNFTMIAFSSALDPLRMANHLSSQKLYEWTTFSEDGNSVRSSDGIKVEVDKNISDTVKLDILIVVGGIDIINSYSANQLNWLRKQNNLGVQMGGICTGAYVLAAAGLLDGREFSVHWECVACVSETFPKVIPNNQLYTLSKDRITSSGGISPLDMMMALIQKQHGSELTAGISDMFIHDKVRSEQDYQRIPMRHKIGSTQPKLLELITLMENNLEEPISLDELSSFINISRRQLERIFQKHFTCTPSRYYLRLRLERAKQLLKQTSLSIIEISTACGFVSTPHFSKCYKEYMGIPPREERNIGKPESNKELSNINAGAPLAEVSQSLRSEPSYGNIPR